MHASKQKHSAKIKRYRQKISEKKNTNTNTKKNSPNTAISGVLICIDALAINALSPRKFCAKSIITLAKLPLLD